MGGDDIKTMVDVISTFPLPPFPQANLSKADATNAVIDRVDFSGSNLTGMTLRNAIITG